jgi:hypothetical protein
MLDLGTRRRCVDSFTPWQLYPRIKSPRYSLDRKLIVSSRIKYLVIRVRY